MRGDWQNLSALLADRAAGAGDRRFGMVEGDRTLGDTWALAGRVAGTLFELGLRPGQRVAVIGTNSDDYLVTWAALQLVGVEAALINPTYPAALLTEMLAGLEPGAVVWAGPALDRGVCASAIHLDLGAVTYGRIGVEHAASDPAGTVAVGPAVGDLPGLGRRAGDIAGYMHTSGTTGTPKFCVQTHEYFIRLGRFIADSMAIGGDDTVFAPLPLFHINPLGYGVIGGLVGGAGVVSTERFSASRFWAQVRDADVTALILHAPPVEILKRATTPVDAEGHRVRIVFFADRDFLDTFEIPLGISAYGSTEVGGLSHVWMWRRGDDPDLPEGMSRYGGRGRHEVEWRVDDAGEIHVRANRARVLFEGYRRGGRIDPALDTDGWFATGDLGRIDAAGNLVFIERLAESIRVKGEYVPIGFVEEHFARVVGISDVAVWREESELVDHEVALFVAADAIDVDRLRAVSAELPAFMRPSKVVWVKEIPRDAGVGKIRRRSLGDADVIERIAL